MKNKQDTPAQKAPNLNGLKEISTDKTFMLIEPGNLVLLTTRDNSKNNVMALSWIMPMDFAARFALVTGSWNYSCRALEKTRQCVLAIPPAGILKKAVSTGNLDGGEVDDKFAECGLTPLPARDVCAPLVAECIANIECKIVDRIKKHDIFILQGITAWLNPKLRKAKRVHAVGNGTFIEDGRTINLKKFMLKRPDIEDL